MKTKLFRFRNWLPDFGAASVLHAARLNRKSAADLFHRIVGLDDDGER